VSPAAGRLNELNLPVLAIVGEYDTPYLLAAAETMQNNLPLARKVIINNAAHLPNMEQPDEFRRIVTTFLDEGIHPDFKGPVAK
jgi:pimeloyl-ACP methyl ester carboxylesterase